MAPSRGHQPLGHPATPPSSGTALQASHAADSLPPWLWDLESYCARCSSMPRHSPCVPSVTFPSRCHDPTADTLCPAGNTWAPGGGVVDIPNLLSSAPPCRWAPAASRWEPGARGLLASLQDVCRVGGRAGGRQAQREGGGRPGAAARSPLRHEDATPSAWMATEPNVSTAPSHAGCPGSLTAQRVTQLALLQPHKFHSHNRAIAISHVHVRRASAGEGRRGA